MNDNLDDQNLVVPAKPAAQPKELSETKPAAGGGEFNLDVILDVPVMLAAEIGRSKLPIRKLVSLAQGSVVELDREVNEPLDLLVNGTLIARGEVVVVGEKFGIRLTDIVSPADRIKTLK